jgi:REP element-mobilizing transposase RayT
MARPLRFVPPGALVEVTTRTIHARFLLRPSPEVNDLILGVVGRAQSLFPVRIHAFVVLSNHWHALMSVDDAAQLAAFVAFVNGNVAKEIGRLHEWRHRFWARRYRAIVVADDDAAVARLHYILKNGCQEGLVDRPVDWPGLSCVRALTAGDQLTGTWYDRTAEFNARRRGENVIPGMFATRYHVHLAPLPPWRHLSPARHRAACAGLVAAIETETRAERADSQRICVGCDRILEQHPHDRPVQSDSSPAPLVHASSREFRSAFRRAYAAFVDAFRAAAAALRRRQRADFPAGAFPPALPFVAVPSPAS